MKPDFPIEHLVPHSGAMLLLDGVDVYTPTRLEAHFTPLASNLFCDAHGALPVWITVEMMAQAVAAHAGVQYRLRGEPIPVGFLVGVRRFRSFQSTIPTHTRLQIEVREITDDGHGLLLWEGLVQAGEMEVARARITVYEPEDLASFLAGATGGLTGG